MGTQLSRRDIMKLGTAGGAGSLLALYGGNLPAPLAKELEHRQSGRVSGIKIKDIDCFRVNVPWPEEDIKRGKMNSYAVVKITTTAGITGYSFGYVNYEGETKEKIRHMLIGKDPFAIEQFLGQGLVNWASVEHALWDIIGKAAGMPVHKLLGGNKKKTRYYITMVWQGKPDQSHLDPEKQAEDILEYNRLGYNAVKIRSWRPDIMEDVKVAKHVLSRATPGFRLMFDRTAQYPGWVWTYEQAYQVAEGMQDAGVYWLEECFEVGDMTKSAKLTKAMDMYITGGEHDRDIHPFARYLANDVFDIVQPDGFTAGGILTIKKIGSMAQAFNKPCILHGTHSLFMFGWLQINASLTNCEYQEIGLIRPPILPHEQWEPGIKLLNSPEMFEMDKEYITIPQEPGLGMDVNEDALEEYRLGI